MAENVPATEEPRRAVRAGVETGLVFSIVAAMIGLAFNAGIQYANVNSNTSRLGLLETKYTALHDKEAEDSGATNIQLTHISTLLGEMQQQQQQIQQSIDRKAR